jgi:hypothetical protein
MEIKTLQHILACRRWTAAVPQSLACSLIDAPSDPIGIVARRIAMEAPRGPPGTQGAISSFNVPLLPLNFVDCVSVVFKPVSWSCRAPVELVGNDERIDGTPDC